jgi:hypothetical protein
MKNANNEVCILYKNPGFWLVNSRCIFRVFSYLGLISFIFTGYLHQDLTFLPSRASNRQIHSREGKKVKYHARGKKDKSFTTEHFRVSNLNNHITLRIKIKKTKHDISVQYYEVWILLCFYNIFCDCYLSLLPVDQCLANNNIVIYPFSF